MTPLTLDNSTRSQPQTNAGDRNALGNGASLANDDQLSWQSIGAANLASRRSGARSVRKQQVAEFTSQLAIMTRSGVDVATALGSLASQCRRPGLASVLSEVHEAVVAGNSLSDALGKHTGVFGASFIATVAAGEASGRMPRVLQQLAKIQRNEIRSRRSIRAMLTYPVLLMTVSSSVIVALVLFVLPRFSAIFEQYDLTLPPVTRLLIGVAAELRTRWFLWAPLALAIVPALLTWRKTAGGRRWLDSLWVRLVIIRDVYVTHLVARICQTLGLMLDSGVPLIDSLQLTRRATGNTLFRELLADLEEAVNNGRSLSSVLQETNLLPQSAREMIITAEETGALAEVTGLLGEHYEEEAEAGMRQLVGLLEPLITVGMGLLVVVIVLAVMLPVFDISTLAQRGH